MNGEILLKIAISNELRARAFSAARGEFKSEIKRRMKKGIIAYSPLAEKRQRQALLFQLSEPPERSGLLDSLHKTKGRFKTEEGFRRFVKDLNNDGSPGASL